ncbi:2-oxoacid:ferredoxin oxidoreductase subunit gamma [Syntrophotalea acetylenivorans]|uniref:2-oxoacid:ferredoxin oxidoreductase subunit gamma n=1 Tax=Syntrophotalea acetylenivorans TaxID=1842532 RepID=A0A1L3GSV1_9BACT|nr:2-oxoacid:acceptor oxidoreductase family protein [Syntrophotalea acetylenivorans]APG29001.1 2-oxoacid:ferredoxin oxidoreductase subunit gamma [Syntrophotalea acetylenivorans]
MNEDVFMAGFGGQGILLIGNLLAYAAIEAGKNASFFPAYGPEKRGGAAMCSVIVADQDIGSPVVGEPGNVLLLNQNSMEKYFPRVRSGGLCLYNSSLIDASDYQRSDINVLAIPANEIATEVGNVKLANMVMLGALLALNPMVSLESIKQALDIIIPERNKRFIPANLQALDRGYDFAKA